MADEPTLLIPHVVPPDSTATLQDALEDRLPPDVVETAATPDETEEILPDVEGVVTFRMPDLDGANSLQWVQALSAGVDSYDRAALRENDVVLTNASGVHAEPIAEQVLGYMLMFERDLVRGVRQQAERTWLRWQGGELRGQTLGILGLGAIGSRVAELGSALGMTVVGTKRDTSDAPDATDSVYPASDHLRLCREADYLVVACPLTDETEGLVDADALRALGRDGVLVNIARGEVVDQDALVRYLQSGLLEGAALDVFAEEPLPAESVLWDLPNVVVTPHQSGSTPHYEQRCADIVVENYDALRGDGEWRNRIE